MLSPLRKRAGRRLREPFGKAGLTVAVIALVFAMLGGAYAAGKLTSKQKKEVEKIAKKFQGTGPAGAQGAAGSNGKDGAQGGKGETGPQGKQGNPGAPGVDGEDGACSLGNTECVLPPGATMTGTWSFSAPSGGTATGEPFEGEEALASISFPLQVKGAALQAEWIGLDFWLEETGEEFDKSHCHGEAQSPEADPGYLCVYASAVNFNSGKGNKREFDRLEMLQLNGGVKPSGVVLPFKFKDLEKPAVGAGTWAATAPCPVGEPNC
jgi:hypothetical protein